MPEEGPLKPPRSVRYGHHTDISRRIGELLRTSLGVWLAAACVNVVALVSSRSLGLAPTIPLVAATAVVAGLVVWAAGRVAIRRGGVAIEQRRVSKRRIFAMILAVCVAAAATGVVVRLIITVIQTFEASVDPRSVE